MTMVGATTREMLSRFESLGDENRLRILTLLERHEFTVSELVSVLQLPQSTVSRHLRVLADDGWVRRRQDGKTRYYRLEGALEPGARELWRLTAESLSDAVWIAEDGERAASVLARRRERAAAFFSETAGGWDALRDDLFGRDARFAPLFGLLDPEWVVGDLGAGTGTLADTIAPFVKRVIAVDRSPEMLEAAAVRLGRHDNVDLREGELETLPLGDDELDVAVLMLVLHFAVDPGRVLAEAARVLAPGGRLVVLDMRAHGREEYRETMGHLWPGFSEDQMRGWMAAADLDAYRHIPLAPDPNASGPMLFAGTARKPSEPSTTTGRLYI
ncbi:ArsR/SmtB family transcription factor [Candidatus Palauibacter sp.]|uniref:ArsR/SmtB family transcription factor n=1 Tax=Candidatus Palauibacter sp. TaxID=3101350 RepID=UPI003CC5AB9B